MAPGGVVAALQDASHALGILSADCRLSGLRERQRTLTSKLRESVDTIEWLIAYECSAVEPAEVGR